MLLDEMPAELSFHVPESHHKRIIGVQGKTIQAIMKDLGVYVKFSSADEHAVSGGYEENEDNVIARTPRKNGDKLERLKKAIMDLVLVKVSFFSLQTILRNTMVKEKADQAGPGLRQRDAQSAGLLSPHIVRQQARDSARH